MSCLIKHLLVTIAIITVFDPFIQLEQGLELLKLLDI